MKFSEMNQEEKDFWKQVFCSVLSTAFISEKDTDLEFEIAEGYADRAVWLIRERTNQ